MLSLLKKTTNLYLKNFWLYLKIISPLLIPLLALRLIAHYTYLGRLTIIFSTLFGIILVIVALLVEISLISTSYRLLKTKGTDDYTPASNSSLFFPYLYLKIIIALITLSLPLFLKSLQNYVTDTVFYFFNIISFGWIVAWAFLLLFGPYVLIIKKMNTAKSLKYSINLFLQKPISIILKFSSGVIFFGLILVILGSLTNVLIAVLIDQTAILFNPYLSPWWQKLVIDIYTLLGLPIVVIITTIIFYEIRTSNRAGNSYPAKN